MITSMTAFARQLEAFESAVGAYTIVWEIRTVNHRYLEAVFKLPETLRQIEPDARKRLRKQLSRGKLECTLRIHYQIYSTASLSFNQNLLAQVIANAETVQKVLSQPGLIDPLQVLQWPGVLVESVLDENVLHQQALLVFDKALEQLVANRASEGAEIQTYIERRLDAMDQVVASVRERMPAILATQRQALQQRLQTLAIEVNQDRFEQEMLILVHKADIDEELDRLCAHKNQVRDVLATGGPCGRRLDFIMQELNREANTLAAKSIDSDMTHSSVELKVLIEQMREQIQNIQ